MSYVNLPLYDLAAKAKRLSLIFICTCLAIFHVLRLILLVMVSASLQGCAEERPDLHPILVSNCVTNWLITIIYTVLTIAVAIVTYMLVSRYQQEVQVQQQTYDDLGSNKFEL